MEIWEIKEDIGAEPREKGICVFHQQRRSYGDGNTAYKMARTRGLHVGIDDFPCMLQL